MRAGIGLLLSLALSRCRTSPRAARASRESAHLKDPAAGAAFLARVAPLAAGARSGLLFAGGLLVAVAARARLAAPALLRAWPSISSSRTAD
jgi:hypothetical protein